MHLHEATTYLLFEVLKGSLVLCLELFRVLGCLGFALGAECCELLLSCGYSPEASSVKVLWGEGRGGEKE